MFDMINYAVKNNVRIFIDPTPVTPLDKTFCIRMVSGDFTQTTRTDYGILANTFNPNTVMKTILDNMLESINAAKEKHTRNVEDSEKQAELEEFFKGYLSADEQKLLNQ